MKAHLLMNSESQDTLFEDIGSQVSSFIYIPNKRINSKASSLILLGDVNSRDRFSNSFFKLRYSS